MSRVLRALRSKVLGVSTDGGMSTAEYCVGVVAVVAFAALLYHVLTSSGVQGLVMGLISRALEARF